MGDILPALINAECFDFRSVIVEYFVHFCGGVLIFPVITNNNDRFQAVLFAFPDHHAGLDAFGSGFIRAGRDCRSMLTAYDSNRFTA